MVVHTPLCHCGCGKKCYPADIARGYATVLDLHCGTIYFARKVACAQKFLVTRRPDLKEEILQYYARVGKFQGKGSGRWKRAIHSTSRSLPDSATLTLSDFLGDCISHKPALQDPA